MKKLLWVLYAMVLSFAIPKYAYAMHIAEGALSLNFCLFYFLICAPFVVLSVIKLRKCIKKSSDLKMLLGLMAAYIFMMSAIKLPSVSGSSSHPTGTGLGSILFGPIVMVVISLIVLIFQAILLAHGGLTTLGANTLSMGIIGPFIGYGVYSLFKKKNKNVAIFLGCAIGNLSTYAFTAFQLALAHPDKTNGFIGSFIKFSGIFAVTQIPLAIVEGIISVILFDFIRKYCKKELQQLEEELS